MPPWNRLARAKQACSIFSRKLANLIPMKTTTILLFAFSRSYQCIGASFLDFNSFNPYASMHVVFHIYGSLEVKAALNNSAPYDSIFVFGVACKCFCKFNSYLHRVHNIEGRGNRLARRCAKANGVLLWLRKSRRPML